jgi:hypothetical protein
VLIVGTIAWGFYLGDLLKVIDGRKALARKQVMIQIFILILGLVLPGPYYSLRRTSVLVTPLMREYSVLGDSHNNIIQNELAEGNLNPIVKPLPHLTGLPAMDEDPENWINTCATDLYGLNSIVAENTSH